MGSMPHKPPANYGWHIRMLQGLAATADKDKRFDGPNRTLIRHFVNKLTVLLTAEPSDQKTEE